MASFFLAPDPLQSTFFIPGGAIPGNGAQVFIYLAGTTTKQTVYKDNLGNTAWSNPIVLDSGGNLASGGVIWIPTGVTIKAVYAPSNDTDPPASPYRTIDNIAGINDTNALVSEWISGPTPTYISATSFSLVGDQTATFRVGRRLKITDSGGTKYVTVTASAFSTLTTVTVIVDSGSLVAALTAVSYALLDPLNASIPFSKGSATGLTSAFNYVQRSALAGLTLSTAGGSATMAIAAGAATDSTNVASMVLAAAISKTTSAWAVGTGNGGLDTGAIANSTWYHFYLILRPDTGVVDVLFSTSASAPTMPTNYTYKRRIGSGKTDGSAQWTLFTQDGDYFRWAVSILDVNQGTPGSTAVSRTLTVPTGVNVYAKMNVQIIDTAGVENAHLSDLAANDEGASGTAAPLSQLQSPAANIASYELMEIRTNTSAQIRSRVGTGAATATLRIATLGWIDRRGRDS